MVDGLGLHFGTIFFDYQIIASVLNFILVQKFLFCLLNSLYV